MKVIATVTHDVYLCQVSHTELEKFLGLYYGNRKRLEVGEEVDLGTGYDWASDVQNSLAKTRDFVLANKPIIQSLMSGYSLLTSLAAPRPDAGKGE